MKFAIAPKYWARHNVSDGYWASEQNIYSLFHYMDRKGRMFTADACRKELQRYKKTSARYRKLNVRPEGAQLKLLQAHAWYVYKKAYVCKIARGVERRWKRLTHKR